MTTISSRSGRLPWAKPAIALQVEREALEEPHHVAQPIAPPFEHFDLVVQSFDKAAGLAVDEFAASSAAPETCSILSHATVYAVAVHSNGVRKRALL